MISTREIIQALTQKPVTGKDLVITEAVIDSRKAIPGSLFVALEGEQTDGHRFIQAAFNKGAQVAIIHKEVDNSLRVIDIRQTNSIREISLPEPPFCIRVEDSLKALQEVARFWRDKLDLRVVGITGSVGKSSTKELTAEVLSRRFHTYKNPGNYNNEIGLPLSLLNLGRGYEVMVAEMGFYYPGEIAFLCGIAKPQIGVITNVGTVHAERAGTREEIARGKSELVESLPLSPLGTAILNMDDPFVKAMAEKTRADVVFYGLDPKADIWADEIEGRGLQGILFRLHFQGESMKLQVPLLGRHSVQTILRACAVGFSLGMNWEEVSEGLLGSSSQLRMVSVKTESGALILDDTYNATPESTIAALDLLGEIKGQKIAVLGDMLELGQYEVDGHQQVGRRAAEVVSHLIAVGPRGKIIAETATQRGLPPSAVTWVNDAVEAAGLLKYNLREGDVVLVKGSHGLRMDRISAILEEAA